MLTLLVIGLLSGIVTGLSPCVLPVLPALLTTSAAGPAAGGILADWGADVVKIEPPDGEMMAVLMPITSPFSLNSGPPELPRLMAASVWM